MSDMKPIGIIYQEGYWNRAHRLQPDTLEEAKMKSNNEDKDIKLTALRERLLEGEKSPLVKDFDFEVFLDELNDQYTHDA
ncbi:MAG: type II toxin-antitoxin system ParD family antitoxin [Candidatus Thiodiazotropha taylori]|uniref:Type II toxin-antitoxin system ParD family antitoxin n=1 Tax=Candidatus Thiodiazotropha taylori TaxID=2792791 RepID=A0A9E4N7Y6_9GAMM|nr:type II toxin-antitoxin system ParD family antitoxin [Candidatus Thiodiazotropha taylori]MCW4259302.1 type II toxin-antitoxin system ParD family antitoxin [Candidatus Thiodiazotropha taylori]